MIFYERPSLALYQGHALDVLREMPSESVHCCVTSPPYWGLRDYGIEPQIWPNGNQACEAHECEHEWGDGIIDKSHRQRNGASGGLHDGRGDNGLEAINQVVYEKGSFCLRCGAWRGSLGLEPTIGLFMQHLMEVMGQCKRVLRRDGVCWVNLGDSYAAGKQGQDSFGDPSSTLNNGGRNTKTGEKMPTIQRKAPPGLKPKDLCLIPFRFALACQEQGWYVRSVIIWAKKSPMPESVTDRPTTAHEYIFQLTRSEKYFYDAEAVREPHKEPWRGNGDEESKGTKAYDSHDCLASAAFKWGVRLYNPAGRNLRTVWELGPEPFPDAHFATFPSEVPRRCIKAATPEAGCCSKCGKPWVRVLEKKGLTAHDGETDCQYEKGSTAHRMSLLRQAARARGEEYHNEVRTLGFRAACDCEAPSQPSVVLDPFGGSGTVGIVANELGRRAVLIELNPDYCAMARERLRQEPLPL